MTSMAAIPAQFQSGFLLNFLTLSSPEISEMEISPGWTFGSTERETKSPRPSTAQPSQSKPGPRLATVAGAKALTEAKMGSGSAMETAILEGTERLHLNLKIGLAGDDDEKEIVVVVGFAGERKQLYMVAIGESECKTPAMRLTDLLQCV